MNATGSRHLSSNDFAFYIQKAIPIEHPIPGSPRVILYIDPPRHRIGIRGPALPYEEPSPHGLENLTVHVVHIEGQRQIELAVTESEIFEDAYPLLCAVADRIQIDKHSVTRALAETLQRLGHLLRREETPSLELELGFLGELSIVAGLERSIGSMAALQAWRSGGSPEEHDFDISDFDLEVKTTSSERRTHWISSLTQLVPTGQRALWLASIQLTRAGAHGTTLGDMVQRMRNLFEATGSLDSFNTQLQARGWRDSYLSHLHQHWRMRTPPAVFIVNTSFPHLAPDLLVKSGIDLSHITEVKYRLDLTIRPPDICPSNLERVLAIGQEELS